MKKVQVEIYGQEIMIFNGRKDIDSWIKKNPVVVDEDFEVQLDCCSGLAGVMFTEDGEGLWFIYLEEKNLAVLCHESLHISYMMLDMVGVQHDAGNHEAFAYLQEFIFKIVAQKLRIPTSV